MNRGYFGKGNHTELFIPDGVTDQFGLMRGISKDDIKSVARAAVRNARRSPLSDEQKYEVIRSAGSVVSDIVSNPDFLRLPEMKVERESLGKTLTDSLLSSGGNIEIFCPVCPDHGVGDRFYRGIGSGIGPEAEGAIASARIILNSLGEQGFNPSIVILVADTENDIPEIIKNSARGDVEFYKSQCQESVYKIEQRLMNMDGISVSTFHDQYGDNFRETQYRYESVLRSSNDSSLVRMIKSIGDERINRHSQILGRAEVNFELTIRYMAQYAALGHLIKLVDGPRMVMNYPTPNRRFFNAHDNVSNRVVLGRFDQKVLAVIGTIVKR